MKYKEPHLQEEFNKLNSLNPQLIEIIKDFESFSMAAFNIEPLVTSIFRDSKQNAAVNAGTGIHSYWRAIDCRSTLYDQNQINQILEYINQKWVYDPSRPNIKVLIYHSVVGGAPHFHFQNLPGKTQKK